MTAEVCVMNRLAAVLAADSATTVTTWKEGERETRYFKGANKIFQLSDFHPVGIMIFASADLLSVPWEVIIKTFRKNLAEKSFNRVDDYAREFFSFLSGELDLFPDDIRKSYFLRATRSSAIRLLLSIINDSDYDRKADDENEQNLEIMKRHVSEWKEKIEALGCNSCFDANAVQEAKHRWKEDVVEMIGQLPRAMPIEKAIAPEEFANFIIEELMKDPTSYFDETGLVFCGFGDKDIFPSATEYQLCGLVDGKATFFHSSDDQITHDTPASIRAYAQTSMADTFTVGISGDVYAKLVKAVTSGVADFAQSVLDKHGIDPGDRQNLDAEIQQTREQIGQEVFESASKEHAYPLREVIASLPLDEMAELAETLINLQSLKEKVTKPTETVGGPVDVAIITKSEGLVWVKRKHFFPPELNSRYAQRTSMLYK